MLQLDYFIQRNVTDVAVNSNPGEEEPKWTITLDGDVKIHNFDPSVPNPPDLTGLALTLITMDSGQQEGSLGTVMFFGSRTEPRKEEVAINPILYALEDPDRPELGVVFPQRSEVNPPVLTPPHPDDRVADGPSQEWIDSQVPEEDQE